MAEWSQKTLEPCTHESQIWSQQSFAQDLKEKSHKTLRDVFALSLIDTKHNKQQGNDLNHGIQEIFSG